MTPKVTYLQINSNANTPISLPRLLHRVTASLFRLVLMSSTLHLNKSLVPRPVSYYTLPISL